MRFQCLECGNEEVRGWLRAATCGTLFFGSLAFFYSQICIGLAWLWRYLSPESAGTPGRLFVWSSVMIGVIALPLSLVLMALCSRLLAWIEYRIVRRRPCLQCGSRNWSQGFERGFGL
jgi:hypothetical protein